MEIACVEQVIENEIKQGLNQRQIAQTYGITFIVADRLGSGQQDDRRAVVGSRTGAHQENGVVWFMLPGEFETLKG